MGPCTVVRAAQRNQPSLQQHTVCRVKDISQPRDYLVPSVFFSLTVTRRRVGHCASLPVPEPAHEHNQLGAAGHPGPPPPLDAPSTADLCRTAVHPNYIHRSDVRTISNMPALRLCDCRACESRRPGCSPSALQTNDTMACPPSMASRRCFRIGSALQGSIVTITRGR